MNTEQLFPDENNEIEVLINRLPKLARQKGRITSEEAAALIANDNRVFSAVAMYTAANPDIFEEWPEEHQEFLRILRRVKLFRPYSGALYRGQPSPCAPGELAIARGFRSWTVSRKIAEDFARDYPPDVGVVCVLEEPVRGVSISDIVTWRMRLTDESHYSGMQAEYLILEGHRS